MRTGRNQDVRNKSGQRLGTKGANTRARVLDCLAQLLEETRGVAPTSAAIARAAGISSPAFYLYFSDVGEALAALLEQREHNLHDVAKHLSEPWPQDDVFDRAYCFVADFMAYWQANATLLRARNRLADQGDERFISLRVESVEHLTRALSARIGTPPFPGGLPCSADAMASVIVTALERLATVLALGLYPQQAAGNGDLFAALANMVAIAIAPDVGQLAAGPPR